SSGHSVAVRIAALTVDVERMVGVLYCCNLQTAYRQVLDQAFSKRRLARIFPASDPENRCAHRLLAPANVRASARSSCVLTLKNGSMLSETGKSMISGGFVIDAKARTDAAPSFVRKFWRLSRNATGQRPKVGCGRPPDAASTT